MKPQRSIWATAFVVWLIVVGLMLLCTGPSEIYRTGDGMKGGAILFLAIAAGIWLNRKFDWYDGR